MSGSFDVAAALHGMGGALMIELASAIMLLGLGRIAGVSGMVARAFGVSDAGASWPWAGAFVLGLPLGAGLVEVFNGAVVAHSPTNPVFLSRGGLLVGFGTRLANRCTSGHGVCGMSRLSIRSVAATVTFMASGIAAVAIMRRLGVG